MKLNRSFSIAALCLGLVPIAVAGMLWSVWKQSSQAQPTVAASAIATAQAPSPANQLAQRSPSTASPPTPAIEQPFSFEDSLNRLSQVDKALASFRRLTEKSKAKLGETATVEVGNADWETQNLGFRNWVGSIEGTLKKQNYQIKKLELDLARKQFEDRQISRTALDQKTSDFKKAEKEFQTFLKSFKVAD